MSILIGQHGTPLPADTTDTRRLKTVLQLIEAEYATPLRIEDAAEACGCSQSHFMRWFKKMTGQGFTAYLNDHRLNLAAELLRITDATVLDIAGRVGFDNLSYFNRLFKRRYGMTGIPQQQSSKNQLRRPECTASGRRSYIFYRAMPHNSKCRCGERGAAAAKVARR